MRVFSGLEPQGNEQSLRLAAERVRLRLKDVPKPRSLCEAGLDEDDYEWLVRWWRALDQGTARRWLSGAPIGESRPTPRNSVLGLLFLLLSAEVARRESREGTVWPLLHGHFQAATFTLLLGSGHPTAEMKDALRAAIRTFSLRNMFDSDAKQTYYATVYLQFGFTQHGISRLPDWLAGCGQSDAVAELLGSAQHSDSFAVFWRSLVQYRRYEIEQDRVRMVLAESPWVLPSWCDEIINTARLRPELDARPDPAIGAGGNCFLSEPRLVWDGMSDPRFEATLSAPKMLDLHADHYDLLLNGDRKAALIRQVDGGYSATTMPTMGFDRSDVTAELVAPDLVSVAQSGVFLWDANEDITVWNLGSGKPVRAWRDVLSQYQCYALLTRSDLDISPRPSAWRSVADGAFSLSYLPTSWPSEMKVVLDGIPLWEPNLRTPPDEPEWTKRIRVYPSSNAAYLGEEISLTISSLPEDAELLYVRLQGGSLRFKREETRAILEPFVLTANLAATGIHIVMGLFRAGTRHRVEFVPPLLIRGTARRRDDQWVTVLSDDEVTVQDAATSVWRLYSPDEVPIDLLRERALMEGSTSWRQVPQRSGPLGKLAGYGDALLVRSGRYNEGSIVLRIADRVTDPGMIASVNSVLGGMLQVELRQPSDPGADHAVIVWQAGMPPRTLPGSAIHVYSDWCWGLGVPLDDRSDLAVGIAYRGERLGASWPKRGQDLLASEAPHIAAAMARWLHLPLLSASYRGAMRLLVSKAPVEVLLAWLGNAGLPAGLKHTPITEAWQAVVRQFFWDWRPTDSEALHLCKGLAPESEQSPLITLVSQITAISPLLLNTLLPAWFRSCPTDRLTPGWEAMQMMRRQFLASNDAPAGSIKMAREWKLCEVAAHLGDDHFVEGTLIRYAFQLLEDGEIPTLQRHNLLIALQDGVFRAYLAERMIERFMQRGKE